MYTLIDPQRAESFSSAQPFMSTPRFPLLQISSRRASLQNARCHHLEKGLSLTQFTTTSTAKGGCHCLALASSKPMRTRLLGFDGSYQRPTEVTRNSTTLTGNEGESVALSNFKGNMSWIHACILSSQKPELHVMMRSPHQIPCTTFCPSLIHISAPTRPY